MTLLPMILTGFAVVTAGPTVLLLCECVAGAFAPRPARPAPTKRTARVAVVIPAHDEAAGIGATLDGVLAQISDGDRVVVVADNCADATAAVARDHGAEVVERMDPQRCGKGYALALGFARVLEDPEVSVVIVVDADCRLTEVTIDHLADAALRLGRPIQADNVVECRADDPLARLSVFAFRLRNRLRPRGLARLGGPCHLAGTGMAFLRRHLRDAPHMCGHLAEDLALGVELALSGHVPAFCEDAGVRSDLSPTRDGREMQRRRWERGHLITLGTTVPRMILGAVRRRSPQLGLGAMDLGIPPLSAHVALLLTGFGASAVAMALGMSAVPAALWAGELTMVGVSVGVGYLAVGRDVLHPKDLPAISLYLATRLFSHVRWTVDRKSSVWLRAKR